MAFSHTDSRLLSGSEDGIINVWDGLTGGIQFQIAHESEILEAFFSPDDRSIISRSRGGYTRIIDSFTGQEVKLIETNRGYHVHTDNFSTDNKWIAFPDDLTGQVWDTSRNVDIAYLPGVPMAFANDNRWVLIRNDYHADFYIWQPEDMIEYICLRLERNLSQIEWDQYIGNAMPFQSVCPNLPIESEATPTPMP